MEGKRAAAAAALCCLLVVLRSGQPQPVAAMYNSMFCNCYKSKLCICYRACSANCLSKNHPGVKCQFKCANYCWPKEPAIVPASAADCGRICRWLPELSCTTATGEASRAGPADVEDSG